MLHELQVSDVRVVPDSPVSDVGEGPIWDDRSHSLLWVDVTGRAVHRYWPGSGSVTSWPVASPIGAAAFSGDDQLLLALENGVYLAGADLDQLSLIVRPASLTSGFRLNDGKVGPDGRFWVGTLAYDDRAKSCELIAIDTDGRAVTMQDNVGLSNGLDWSPDGSTFYYIDSHAGVVARWRERQGGIWHPVDVFADLRGLGGMPDGLTVDLDGHVWVAMWGGAAVHRFTPDGTLEGTIALPVSNVTSCSFGGDGLATLFVTTGTYGLSAEARAAQPLAGRLLAVDTAYTGLAARRFTGQREASG